MHIEHIPGFAIESPTPSLPRTKIDMLVMVMVKSQFILQSSSFDRLDFLMAFTCRLYQSIPSFPFTWAVIRRA